MHAVPRQAYLDWLRIIAIALVLLLHSAMPFAAELDWHIRNKETSSALLEMNFFLHLFRMPLLFFISGAISFCMLQRRSGAGFIGLRFTRLFIPLLFGMLVVVPPQVYMERVSQGFKGNFFDFYGTIFTTGAYPKGNLSWHHLWFILYLLIYDIICAPFFAWLASPSADRFRQRLQWLGTGAFVYLVTLPGIIIYASMSLKYPETNSLVDDWGYFLYWLCFLVPGFLCMAVPGVMESLARNRRISAAVAFFGLLFINYLRWNDVEPWSVIADWRQDARTYLYLAGRAACAWAWVLTAVGYGKVYLDSKTPALAYLNQAVYPFYILHQTVIVILAFYAVAADETIGVKFIFIVLVTVFISMGIYHLLIRPFAITRFLFGMRPEKKAVKPVDSGRTLINNLV
jgi:glucans biosynthesis protein C